MNRLEFMKQLARLLDDLPREEKIEVLKYYNGYFDDAGVENEAEIIAQLGSPENVAAEVKAGMMDEFITEKSSGEQDDHVVRRKKKNRWTPLVIAILLILTFRIWFGLLMGLFGMAMGLIGLLLGLVGSAVGCLVTGVVTLVTAPLTGMLSVAVGIFLLGALLLVGLLVGLVFGKLIPLLINVIRKLVHGVKDAIGGILDGMTGRG